MTIHSSYLRNGFTSVARRGAIKQFRAMVKAVEFDTIVVSGMSGLLMGPMLSHLCRKGLIVVRKAKDNSHSCMLAEGDFSGTRLVFVDDFISSGRTMERVNNTLEDERAMSRGWKWAGVYLWNSWTSESSSKPVLPEAYGDIPVYCHRYDKTDGPIVRSFR